MSQERWDRDYLDLAQWWADRRSKDPSTKVGAVVTTADNRVVSMGYNGFPPGLPDNPELYADRDYKLRMVAHAERNALDLCDGPVAGGTIYVSPLPCCAECAKSIVQKRLKRVVIRGGRLGEERWKASWNDARQILSCAGVTIKVVD